VAVAIHQNASFSSEAQNNALKHRRKYSKNPSNRLLCHSHPLEIWIFGESYHSNEFQGQKTSALPSSMDENWRNPTAIILYYFSITLSIKYFVKQLLTIHNVGSFFFLEKSVEKGGGKDF